MSDYVVSETAECYWVTATCGPGTKECRGCIGNGRRLLLDTATPVERQPGDRQGYSDETIYVPLGDSGDTETEQEQP